MENEVNCPCNRSVNALSLSLLEVVSVGWHISALQYVSVSLANSSRILPVCFLGEQKCQTWVTA